MKVTKEQKSKIIDRALKDAESREIGAAYNGEWGRGGADEIRKAVEAWLRPKDVVPPILERYAIEEEKEWEEFQRLKKKFNE